MCSFVILACPHFTGTESRLESNGRTEWNTESLLLRRDGFSTAAVAAMAGAAALWRLPLPPGHMMSSDARARFCVRLVRDRPEGAGAVEQGLRSRE